MIELLWIGDSLTSGFVSPPFGPSYDVIVSQTYSIGETGNAALGGTTTWSYQPGTTAWEEEVLSRLPAETAFVLLGSNDSIGWRLPFPTPPDIYRSNMEAIIDGLLDEGVGRIVLGIPPDRYDEFVPAQAYILAYEVELYAICAAIAEVECGPNMRDALDPALGHYTPEVFGGKVHPNGAGHLAMADATLEYLPEPAAVPSGVAALLALALLVMGAREASE